MSKLIGTGVALVTPFKSDLTVDHAALRRIVEFNIDNNIEYLVILGTTAESATLSKQEKGDVINTVISANKNRLPLVLGVGGNNTQEVITTLKTTNLSPFAAVLSVSPYYNRPTQEGIYQHFKAVAEASTIPVILYNVPSRTASNMLPETVLKLANNFPNIIAIKEAAGSLTQAMTLIKEKPSDFNVISGDDMLALPMTLAGGSGVISVIGQGFPKAFSQMIRLGLEGRANDAYSLHYDHSTLIDLIFEEGNPAGIKAVLEVLELCSCDVRLPLVCATNKLKTKILESMRMLNS